MIRFYYVAAAGDLPNDKVPNCHTCKKHGHPHEAVTFEKVNGRLRNDGTYETAYWKLRDYFTVGHINTSSNKGGSTKK
jgi:hypothetical protein